MLHVSLSCRVVMLDLEKKGLGSLENLAKGCRQWAQLEVRQEFVVGPVYARPNSRFQGHGVKSEVVWGK